MTSVASQLPPSVAAPVPRDGVVAAPSWHLCPGSRVFLCPFPTWGWHHQLTPARAPNPRVSFSKPWLPFSPFSSLIYLKESRGQTGRNGFHLLVHPPDVCSGQRWADLIPGASPTWGQEPEHWLHWSLHLSSIGLSKPLAGLEVEQTGLEPAPVGSATGGRFTYPNLGFETLMWARLSVTWGKPEACLLCTCVGSSSQLRATAGARS